MRTSTSTIRYQGIAYDKTAEDVKRDALGHLEDTKTGKRRIAKIFSSKRTNDRIPGYDRVVSVSLAQQETSRTATVTFANQVDKDHVLETGRQKKKSSTQEFDMDDEFGGLTVLYSGIDGRNPDLDICAVHGLNGHAFDTWMADTNMWLRDQLPQHPQFNTSRIMTYGYNSTLMDKRELQTRFSDFADGLLALLGSLRSTPEARKRPLLLVCHSMGGLVARLAMVRYDKYPHKYPGVMFGPCGLFLLSTPNAGSMASDWSDYMVSLAGTIAGVRPNLINELRVLNPRHVDGIDDWRTLKNVPIVRCFCESSKTFSKTGSRQIVTASSAGFLQDTAMILPQTDHHTVCKFETSSSPAFVIVMGGLCQMKETLLSEAAEILPVPVKRVQVGRPDIIAPSYPLLGPQVFNSGFRKPTRDFIKRPDLLMDATKTINGNDKAKRVLILTGMAGSGKTELLLELVNQQAMHRNVVLLSASNHAGVRQKLEEYACMLGHDTIQGDAPLPGLPERWRACSAKVQGDLFLAWAADARNNCIVILDELDDVREVHEISKDLPQSSRAIISTRNPEVFKQLKLRFDCVDLSVSELEMDEAILLSRSLLSSNGIAISPKQANRLAIALGRHPFAICAAAAYLPGLSLLQDSAEYESTVDIFLEVFDGSDYQDRADFFEYEGLWGLSISRLFKSTLSHLEKQCATTDADYSVHPILQAIAFVSDPDRSCRFVHFFNAIKPRWRSKIPGEYEVSSVFDKGIRKERQTLDKAIQASLIIERAGQMYMPGLWRDCMMLYECDSSKRQYWLKQILLLCFFHSKENDSSQELRPYVDNCIHIASRYDIAWESLLLHTDQRSWLMDTITPTPNCHELDDLLKEIQQAVEAHQKPSGAVSDMNATYARLAKKYTDLKSEYCIGALSPELDQTIEEIEEALATAAKAAKNPFWDRSLSHRSWKNESEQAPSEQDATLGR